MKNTKYNWFELIQYLKEYGWFFQNCEIYSGLANSYEFGPLGAELKTQIINSWKKVFVQKQNDIYLIDGNLFLKPEVLKSSGHLKRFHDYIIKCKSCKTINKFDELWPEFAINQLDFETVKQKAISLPKRQCLKCKTLNEAKIHQLDLLFKTGIGVDNTKQKTVYLRPETAQNIFINYPQIVRTLRLKLPFGIAQIGKVFRNEMTTENFVFRTYEFNQMEIEWFYQSEKNTEKWFKFWTEIIDQFLKKSLNLSDVKLRIRKHQKNELAHYAKKTIDFEFAFPFGWKELWGLSARGNYDLSMHQKNSGVKMNGANPTSETIPYVIEPSVGIERLILALIFDKLEKNDNKWILKLPWKFCYYQIALLPLTEKLTTQSEEIYHLLKSKYRIKFDTKKSIGKRYLYHDAIGTYYAITFDFQSLKDKCVTIRYRDNQSQKRIAITNLEQFLQNAHHDNNQWPN